MTHSLISSNILKDERWRKRPNRTCARSVPREITAFCSSLAALLSSACVVCVGRSSLSEALLAHHTHSVPLRHEATPLAMYQPLITTREAPVCRLNNSGVIIRKDLCGHYLRHLTILNTANKVGFNGPKKMWLNVWVAQLHHPIYLHACDIFRCMLLQHKQQIHLFYGK